nr:integrase, catalytic region, zinc finger, CCHC-type, peptidase aspartic, catalytic [Tanacetum cinerariifolium]
MANLSEDIQCAGSDHDHYQEAACAHYEDHMMHDSVQLYHVANSHADNTSDSNIILYDQYVKDNEVPVVHSDVSCVPIDAFMMIYDDMCEPHDQSISYPSRNTAVHNSLTAELATYKEHVELVAIGYKNLLCLTRAKQVQPALYNGHEIIKDNHTPAIVHNSEDTLEITEIIRKKMNDKMNDPECVTRKTKACYLQEVIPLFKTLKDNFEGIQKALTKEVKELKDVFKELEAEVTQYAVDRKRDAIELKNLLIANDNLIVECLSQEVFCMATNSELNVARFTKMYVPNTTAEARCLALEAELANLRDTNNHDNQKDLINHFYKLEVNHLKLQLKYQNLKDNIVNNLPTPDKDTPDFDYVFVIGKMQASLQGKDNVIRQLKKQLSQLHMTRSDTDRNLRVQTTDSQITKLTDQVTYLQAQNDPFRAENDKIKQHYKELYDSIKITRAKHIKQVTKLTTENVNLKTSVSKATVNPQVSARDKHAIYVEPIVPRLRNNRDAHLDYLGHLRESVEIIRDIIEEAKILAYIPLIRKKQVTVAKPFDKSDSTTHRHVVTVKYQKTPSTGVNSFPNASGSQPKSHAKSNRISPAKGGNKLSVEDQPRTNNVERKVKQVWKPKQVRQVWKPTGKVLTTIGHQWRPTGWIFNLGNQCPLTRFTLPKVVSAKPNKKRANKMADVNAPSGQTPAMAPPLRADDQILPHIRWVPIGKSNCYLDLEKSQSNPIYKIAVDLLKSTNFFRAFTASSTIPSIYIQQFWDTILYDKKAGCYRCQLDEQWFVLTKEALREALQITPINNNQAFAAPLSIDGLIDFGVVTRTNIDYVERIWEEFTQSIHTFIKDKQNLSWHTSGKKRATLIVIPSIRFTKLIIHHLQRRHMFYLRPDSPLHLPNEESVLGYLKFSAKGTKREVSGMPILGSLIIAEIQQASYYQEYLAKVAQHRRYLAGETGGVQDPPASKPTQPARKPKTIAPKVPSWPSVSIPVRSTQPAPTSALAKPQEKKRKQATETFDKPPKAKKSKHVWVSKKRSRKKVEASKTEEVPTVEPQVTDEDADCQKVLEKSMKDAYALPRGTLPPVVIREPESGKYQPLPEVPGKGKAKVTEEQAGPDLDAQVKDQMGSDAGAQAEDQTGSDVGAQAEGQARSNPDKTSEGQARSNPDEIFEGQARPDPGGAEAKVQYITSPVVHAGSDREHIDLDVANVSPQPSTEQLDKGFTGTAYPKVQENIKLAIEEQVLLEEPASSSGTLSSLQHLSRDFSFGDQFFSDKPLEVDKNAKTEVESMVNVPIQQALSSISLQTSPIIDLSSRPESPKAHRQFKATTTNTTTTTTTTTLPPPQAPQQSTTEAMMVKRISKLEHIMADLIQVSIAVSEVVTDARMWESKSYKSHEDHMQLFEALEKSMNCDHFEELAQDLAEARKKRKKSRESPKTPPGSPSHQPPLPLPPAGPSRASGAPKASRSAQVPPLPPLPSSTNQESPSKGSAAPSPSKTAASEYQAWMTTDIRLRLSISLTLADLEMDEDMAPDEQVQSSDDEDIGSAHIPTVNLRQGWWKPFEEERPATSKPAWSIRLSDVPTGDIATFMDWFCKRRGITELKPQDLEGPAYEIIKVLHPDVIHLQYQMEECHKLLTDSVDDPILRHNVSKPLPLGGPPGQVTIQSDFFFNKDLEYLRYGSKGCKPALSISKMKAAYYPDAGLEQMVPDQFWIEEECKYDIAAIYGISHWWFQRQRFYIDRHTSEGDRSAMMMRVDEIHKFSDGTLQQIDEALDYRIKEFRINRMNPGLNTRFWTRKDVDQSKAFMFAIQRRLKTKKIFRNLESFVGGRVREEDYRLLKRTE